MIAWNIDALAKPLSHIYNACFLQSYFPAVWKMGLMSTILKPGKEALDFKSRRPLTLLPVIGKGLERVLLNRLMAFKQDWFQDSQYGFQRGSRSEIPQIRLTNYLEENASGPNAVASVQLDFTSAFDRTWHTAILRNLYLKGCPLIYLKLINSFLTCRVTTLHFANGSSSKVLTMSTPQGAVLSPFLWNIFVDPLLRELDRLGFVYTVAWADDITINIKFNRHSTSQLNNMLRTGAQPPRHGVTITRQF